MKKLLPVVISGVMAISFSQLAAAQAAGVQGQAGAGANVDLNTKGSTQAQKELGQSRQQPGSDDTQSGKQKHDATTGATVGATAGATADSSTKTGSEDTNSSPGATKSNKMEGDSSSAGASQSYDKDKDKDKDRDQRGKNKGVSKNKDKDDSGSSTSGSSTSGASTSGDASAGGATSVTK